MIGYMLAIGAGLYLLSGRSDADSRKPRRGPRGSGNLPPKETSRRDISPQEPDVDDDQKLDEALAAAVIAAEQDSAESGERPVPPPRGPRPNRAEATRLAPKVAGNIRRRRYDYDRRLLRQFQLAAAIASDGVYGGASAGALRHYLGSAPPRPLFRPTAEREYPHG